MLCTLKEAAGLAKQAGHGLAAFNVFGYEDAAAVICAAEKTDRPVVLMTNKLAVEHMGIPILAQMLRYMAERAAVPVCVHLDHATELEKIREAAEWGYTSVMIDGSGLPFDENVAITREAASIAHHRGIRVEGEIGSVGYSDHKEVHGRFTEPDEAEKFAKISGVDALAVAVGTVHRMEEQGVDLQFDRLREIYSRVDVPLVIHGSTGVADADLKKLVQAGACKINMGTVLRMTFGHSMRKQLERDPALFDRIKIFQNCMKDVEKKAIDKIKCL